jgi:periplasmic copper chaperone A
MLNKASILLIVAITSLPVQACDLKIDAAWIREAPPNAMAMAGYARLSNSGTRALKIQGFSSTAFGSIEAHESFTENGVAKMRPTAVEIPVKGRVEFAAGGKHLMLMSPTQPLKKGDVVMLKLTDATGCVTSVPFKVSAATAADSHDHASMDHSMLDHSSMKHE